ncbi:MAG TPA: GNAT family N-acetyltransferase [Verrucomicrobiae bacterium]|jgi:GNAT superfamily N-acetyltransferase|nr:GNAT family N-acetyltransferase [Verrucomicrobiae bacterium]
MISETPRVPTESPLPVSLRSEHPTDEAFLLAVYAGTREEELALTGWDDTTRRQFIEMQFKAMRQGYAAAFPNAEFSVVLLDSHSVGRVVVNRSDKEIRIVDMALLPEHRGKGIGTDLMQVWRAESEQSRRPLRLRVVKGTRPVNWYKRLGFVSIDEEGVHDHLEFGGEIFQPGQSSPDAGEKTP